MEVNGVAKVLADDVHDLLTCIFYELLGLVHLTWEKWLLL